MAVPAVGDLLRYSRTGCACSAIAIVGPPNSGKSVLSNALRQQLIQTLDPVARVYLHRASWDGEGNWAYEAETPMVDSLYNTMSFVFMKFRDSQADSRLLPASCQGCEKFATAKRLCAGRYGRLATARKQPLLEECTHYIVISRLQDLLKPGTIVVILC